MAITLAQAILGTQQLSPTMKTVASVFIQNANVLQYLKFQTEKTDKVSWSRELALPSSGSRALNATFTKSDPTIEQKSENLKIYGTTFDADRALLEMGKANSIKNAKVMQLKSVARTFETDFFKGTGTGSGFSGLQSRVLSGQTITAGTNGAALSLTMLDEIVVSCEGNNKVIWVSKAIYLALQKKVRTSSNVNYLPDNFGKMMLTYAGIPVVLAGNTVAGAEILDFSETQGTSSVATSLYITSFDADAVTGIQTSPMHDTDNNVNTPNGAYDVEWIVNYKVSVPNAAYRISGILNSAVVD